MGAPLAFKPSFIGFEQRGRQAKDVGDRLPGNEKRTARLAAPTSAGSLLLATTDENGAPAPVGKAIAGGDPIGLERVRMGGKPEPLGPVVIWAANGAGTRSAIPSTRNKPGLR